jgi:replicative DNA helicase
MAHLYANNRPADMITICDELARRNQINQVGGPVYITELINQVPTSINVEHYAYIVERNAVLRQLIQAAGDIAAMAYEQEVDAVTALNEAEKRIFQIGSGTTGKQPVEHTTALDTYFNSLVDLHDQHATGTISGVPTGFPLLDIKLGGWRRSKLIILAARPGDGKTALALNFADKAVRCGGNVLFFSLEMDEEELMQRWVAMEAKVDSTHLRDGNLGTNEKGDDEWELVMDARNRLAELPGKLFIDDTPGNTVQAMRSKALRYQVEHGVDMIIVDYLQFAKAAAEQDRKYQDRRLEVEEVSRKLKELSREMKVPVLALAQINRDVESRANRRPQLSDLREAGGIEQDCDIALFIHRQPGQENEDPENQPVKIPVDVLIEKHRGGPKGSVPMWYEGRYLKFYPMKPATPEGR